MGSPGIWVRVLAPLLPLFVLSLLVTRAQLSLVGHGPRCPRPSFCRCGVVVQAQKPFGSRSQEAEPLALIVIEG